MFASTENQSHNQNNHNIHNPQPNQHNSLSHIKPNILISLNKPNSIPVIIKNHRIVPDELIPQKIWVSIRSCWLNSQ